MKWKADGEFVGTAKGEGFYCADSVHAQFAARKHNDAVNKERKRLNKLIGLIENNGGGSLLGGDFEQILLFFVKGKKLETKYRNALDAED